jgi:hypothetical protein
MAVTITTTPGTPGAQPLPLATPNSSSPIASITQDVSEQLTDSTGKPVQGTLTLSATVTAAWRYLFGTFVQRSPSVSTTFTLTAGAAYSQTQLQALIAQVQALSKAVGSGQ